MCSHRILRRMLRSGVALIAAVAACTTLAQQGRPAPTMSLMQPSLPAALRVLQRIGCEVEPEASSARLKELECRDDRAYFLCGAMQARDARLDCAIGSGASRIDWEHQDAAAIIAAPAFVATLQAEPCAAWVYPDPGPDKLHYSQLCAAHLLGSLDCTASAAAPAHWSCATAALPACDALRAAGLAEACR